MMRAVALTTTSHAVLGLLSIAPMSGYDLHQAVDRSVRHLWPISKSQVYAELARLEPLGLIRGTDVPQERLPDKRVFRLTEEGEDALDDWLEHGDLEPPQFRLPFLLPALFGHRLGPKRTAELLEQVRAGAESRRDEFGALLEAMEEAPGTEYARLVVLHGLRLAEATASWADEAARRIPSYRVRIDPRRPRPRTAEAMFRMAPTSSGATDE
jgi:DNA-binding PadR family transcriptional regulator